MTVGDNELAPVLFVPHGGGPMPVLGDPGHRGLVRFLEKIPSQLRNVKAILTISAHWEEDLPSVNTAEKPGMLYDYYNFPPESYELKYPAPGAPELARKVAASLQKAGIATAENSERGYDHGVFIPLMIMYPEAGLPIAQLSLANSMDPKLHIEMGKALSELRREGVLIFGSGLSFHNLGELRGDKVAPSIEFNNWLKDACSSSVYTADKRFEMLSGWEEAPSARFCHPREEHLLPLHVCLGAAQGQAAEVVFDEPMWEHAVSGYLWSS